jgi:spore maturation protein SpmA
MKNPASPINAIFLFMIVAAIVTAAYTGKMAAITTESFESAKSAVTLAIAMIGAMALWLGIMKVVEEAGAMRMIARIIRPVMVKLFPDVPPEHPAMSAMIMNIAANALGLGNAATPMGIKAMQELETLNAEKGTATNAMCLFLAINTSSVTLLPLGVINIRAAAGVTNPADIFFPSLFATVCSTICAIIVAKLFARRSSERYCTMAAEAIKPSAASNAITPDTSARLIPPGPIGRIIMILLIIAFMGAIVYRIAQGTMPAMNSSRFLMSLSNWLMPLLMGGLLLFGYFRGVKVYEALTEGAQEGFTIAIRIIPFLVAIFVAIGMFRASGALDLFALIFKPVTSLIGMPPEALPMVFIRPLSGSGAFGYMSQMVTQEPNGFLSFLVSTMQGSTETTFYVLAVYFGSVGITRMRHSIWAGLSADVAGMLASLFVCRLWFY